MYLVVDRMQVVNHLQRDQKTLEFKGEKKTVETTNEKNTEKEKCKNSSRQKHRERRRVRLKRIVRANSGAISMSEVEASSMAEPVSTPKKKKNTSESTEPAKTMYTPCQRRERKK